MTDINSQVRSVGGNSVGTNSNAFPPKISSPSLFDQCDSFTDKAILATLLVLDKGSFISPFRWFVGVTSTEDGQGLTGEGLTRCGGNVPYPPSPDAGLSLGQTGCTVDIDCRDPLLCEKGKCVDPAPTHSPPECHAGDKRNCGPCDVGVQNCSAEGSWESVCNYLSSQLSRSYYSGPAGTANVGLCRPQKQECVNVQGHMLWSVSQTEILPQPEICDGKDNNCDGTTDELKCNGKIGDSCDEDHQCDTKKCIPPRQYPGGYCSEPIKISLTNDECQPGTNYRNSVCVEGSQLGITVADDDHTSQPYCVVTCTIDSECRVEDHYICKQIINSAYKACLPEYEEVTIGQGACGH